jgi:micrococcal nuclease
VESKLVLLFLLIFISSCTITGEAVREFEVIREGPFEVVNVVDGDTADLDNGWRLRFSGINTPETGECYYQEAKDELSRLILGKEVYLENDYSDEGNYGRKLRYVFVGELLVNEELVHGGFAKVYDKYKDDTRMYEGLKDVEFLAARELKGVWGCVDPKAGCAFVASVNSEVYHEPHCKAAKKINVDNLICIGSVEEAISLGLRPASSC